MRTAVVAAVLAAPALTAQAGARTVRTAGGSFTGELIGTNQVVTGGFACSGQL